MKLGLSCCGEVKLVMLWDDFKSISVFGHFPWCRLTLKLPENFWNTLGMRSQRLGNEIARISGTWEFKGFNTFWWFFSDLWKSVYFLITFTHIKEAMMWQGRILEFVKGTDYWFCCYLSGAPPSFGTKCKKFWKQGISRSPEVSLWT